MDSIMVFTIKVKPRSLIEQAVLSHLTLCTDKDT